LAKTYGRIWLASKQIPFNGNQAKMNKILETIGTIAGIIGAFLVATKFGQYGYPFLLISSVCLLYSAIRFNQRNFLALQGVFLSANIIGLFNYV
jgi:nicotinamide riboside transporter PnuC